ncbi:MAG TPA: hypothetical protein VGF14_05095 [Alphaproteobacteria bacterium]
MKNWLYSTALTSLMALTMACQSSNSDATVDDIPVNKEVIGALFATAMTSSCSRTLETCDVKSPSEVIADFNDLLAAGELVLIEKRTTEGDSLSHDQITYIGADNQNWEKHGKGVMRLAVVNGQDTTMHLTYQSDELQYDPKKQTSGLSGIGLGHFEVSINDQVNGMMHLFVRDVEIISKDQQEYSSCVGGFYCTSLDTDNIIPLRKISL